MLKRTFIFAIILIGFSKISYSQDLKNLQEINEIWFKFCKSLDSLDYQLFADIHSKKLIRIPGGKQIIDYDSYMEKYEISFEKAKKENSTRSISLRFFERINNDSTASERGIFKYIKNKNQSDEKISYGKFHVLLIKENGSWKILMDYDSNEGRSVVEEDFTKAYEMGEFEKFIKK